MIVYCITPSLTHHFIHSLTHSHAPSNTHSLTSANTHSDTSSNSPCNTPSHTSSHSFFNAPTNPISNPRSLILQPPLTPSQANGRVFIDAATHDSLPRETKSRLTPLEYELHLKGQARPMRPYYYSSDEPPTVPMGDDIASSNSQYVVLNAEIAAEFGRQLDRVCLPSMRNTLVTDHLMVAGAAALNHPTEGGSQEDTPGSRQMKNAHLLNRTSGKNKASMDRSNHSKHGSSSMHNVSTRISNIIPLEPTFQNTLLNASQRHNSPSEGSDNSNLRGGAQIGNNLSSENSVGSFSVGSRNTGASPMQPFLERRRSSMRKSSLSGNLTGAMNAIGAMVLAVGNTPAAASHKSNTSSDVSQRSAKVHIASKRLAGGLSRRVSGGGAAGGLESLLNESNEPSHRKSSGAGLLAVS